MYALATLLILALIALASWPLVRWQARVRRSDAYIDDLAADLEPSGVTDELDRMLEHYRDSERLRLLEALLICPCPRLVGGERACCHPSQQRPEGVDTPYPAGCGGHEPDPR
jgi:hypothetical protein